MLFYISIFFVPLIIWLILRAVSKRRAPEETEPRTPLEVCALCHEEFEMSELIEKEVGEYGRVYCFCGGCIENLHREFRAEKGADEAEEDEFTTHETPSPQ